MSLVVAADPFAEIEIPPEMEPNAIRQPVMILAWAESRCVLK
jgi:hypothetical protein